MQMRAPMEIQQYICTGVRVIQLYQSKKGKIEDTTLTGFSKRYTVTREENNVCSTLDVRGTVRPHTK